MSEHMAFGHYEGTPLFLDNKSHCYIQASSRTGKGAVLLTPHLCRYPGSVFVLDPKGESAQITGSRREKLNASCHYLDPFGISGKPKSRFNPLASLTLDNIHEEANALATALIFHEGGGDRDDSHWIESAHQLITLFIMWVVVAPDEAVSPEIKDLPRVRTLLLGTHLGETLEEIKLYPELLGGLLVDLAFSFTDLEDKEYSGVVSTARRQTHILDNPRIRASLAAVPADQNVPEPEVSFAEWRHTTMTVYVCLAAPRFPVYKRWLRLILTSALNEMTTVLRPPPLDVHFVLDELSALGRLECVIDAVALSAGYGCKIISVWQSTSQPKGLYGERWDAFVGNSNVKAVFSVNDYDSAKYWSDTVGGHIEHTQSVVKNSFGVDQTTTIAEAVRPLWTPADIMFKFAQRKPFEQRPGVGEPNDEMLVLVQGARPIVAERVPYWFDDSLRGLYNDPPRPANQNMPPNG